MTEGARRENSRKPGGGKARIYMRIAVFAGLFVLFNAALSYWVPPYLFDTTGGFQDDRRFFAQKGAIDVLFVGDSHVACGILPERIPGARSAATLGEDTVTTYFKVSKLLKRYPGEIETAIVPLDLHTFSRKTPVDSINCYVARYVDFFELARVSGCWRECLQNYVEYRLVAYSGLIGKSEQHLDLPRRVEEIRAKHPRGLADWESKDSLANDILCLHFGEGQPVREVNVKYYEELLAAFKQRGINIVIVKYPVSRLYLDRVGAQALLEEVKAAQQTVLSKFPDVQILDYTETFADEEQFFMDADHLSAAGAEAFSDRIRADFTRMGILDPVTSRAGGNGPPLPLVSNAG